MPDLHDIPTEEKDSSAGDARTPHAAATDSSIHAKAAEADAPKKKLNGKHLIFFSTCAVVAILIYAIANIDSLIGVAKTIGSILAPLIIGGVIAYLCNPFLKFYEFVVFRKMKKSGFRLGLSLFLTVVTVLLILGALVALILPELVNSLKELVDNADSYLNSFLRMVQGIIDKIPVINVDVSDKEALIAFIEKTFGSVEDAVAALYQKLQEFISINAVTGVLMNVVTALKNLFLGIFIAFYILSSKEKRVAQIRKFRAAFLTEKQDAKLTELTRLVDQTFGGFIKGLLLDALAVGVVTFIMLSIFRVSKFNLLIAVICAVTNIIPVFGPFIGAIPSAFIVLITNPSKLLLFIILVLVIQQIDGNILVPRIQGSNTGISSLAVLIAITVMGSLFGMMGMIIGVPVFAVIIEMIKRAIEAKLRKKKAPTDTTFYYPADAVGNAEEDVYYEHSHLRYKYEHSKFKTHVDRRREKFAHTKAERQNRRAQKAKRATTKEPDKTKTTRESRPKNLKNTKKK